MNAYGNLSLHFKPADPQAGEIALNRDVSAAQWDAINDVLRPVSWVGRVVRGKPDPVRNQLAKALQGLMELEHWAAPPNSTGSIGDEMKKEFEAAHVALCMAGIKL